MSQRSVNLFRGYVEQVLLEGGQELERPLPVLDPIEGVPVGRDVAPDQSHLAQQSGVLAHGAPGQAGRLAQFSVPQVSSATHERAEDPPRGLALQERVGRLRGLGGASGVQPLIAALLRADYLSVPHQAFDVVARGAERSPQQLLELAKVDARRERDDHPRPLPVLVLQAQLSRSLCYATCPGSTFTSPPWR